MAALFGAATSILLSGCPSPCVEAVYSFKATAEFVPGQDTIQVGDTLFLVSVIPKRLYDSQSGKQVDYADAPSISNTLNIQELPPNTDIPNDAVNQFSYYNIKGSVYNETNIPSPGRVQQLRYQSTTVGYALNVAIISKKKGIYFFNIGNGLSFGRSKQCEKANFETSISNSNQHLYYYEQARPGYTISDYERQHGYCFTVY